MSLIRWAGLGVLVLVLLFGVIQLVPYGRDHSNPAVQQEPEWNSPETRELASNACFDCHSNETTWPWYSNVAPVSWLIQHDVEEGRSFLNLSEWGLREMESEEIGEVVHEGEMPPWYYVMLHPEANLTASEKGLLTQGLVSSTGGEIGDSAGREDNEEGEDNEDRD